MEEEREDAVEPRVQVRRRLPAPHLQGLSDLTAAQDRDKQVAVDALGRREPIVRDRAKAAEPRVVGVDARADRRFTDIVETLVVFGEAEARREGGRVVVLLLQERIDERGERRRQARPPSVGLNGPLPPLQDNGLERSVSLTEYQRKRDFKRTPEPKGRQPKAVPSRRYVVHRHHATRLHWDVRLEMHGVLASWAVPQGPPLEGGKRRLAVHTEDHPLEYLTFHGVIPDGYGAGTMTIWDEGTYDLLKDSESEYKVAFHGQRLEGEWVLVQTKQNEGRDWLMIKHGPVAKDHILDSKIYPMLAITADEPFDSPDFAFEPKWDGVRTLAFVDGGVVRLQTRNLLDCTAQYPEAHQIAEALTGAYQAIVDGEIVALDDKGVPSFQKLQPRMHQRNESELRRLRKSTPIIYEVFDILWADGRDLTKRPLRERQQLLDEALTPMGNIRRSEQFIGTGTALFTAVQEQGLEGIIAKRLDSPNATTRSAAWVKIKAFRTMECVVGGWTEGLGGRAQGLGALLLGIY
ncbi:MAG: hypothetical protein E6J27_02645, partial [Chloroflexi bacterium]